MCAPRSYISIGRQSHLSDNLRKLLGYSEKRKGTSEVCRVGWSGSDKEGSGKKRRAASGIMLKTLTTGSLKRQGPASSKKYDNSGAVALLIRVSVEQAIRDEPLDSFVEWSALEKQACNQDLREEHVNRMNRKDTATQTGIRTERSVRSSQCPRHVQQSTALPQRQATARKNLPVARASPRDSLFSAHARVLMVAVFSRV